MATKRKQKGIISDSLILDDLEPESLNFIQGVPLDEQILSEKTGDFDEQVLSEELPISLEDQILSRMDNEGEELAPTTTLFNSNFASSIPEAVKDKIATYLKEVTEKDKKNRGPWLDII